MKTLYQITPYTWFFISLVILILLNKQFKLRERVIFFLAKRGNAWAKRQVLHIKNEYEAKDIKRKKKDLRRYIARANELSKAHNGKRFYVIEYGSGYVITDSKKGFQLLGCSPFMSECTKYYTPTTRLTVNNIK